VLAGLFVLGAGTLTFRKRRVRARRPFAVERLKERGLSP
jgi:hypothetical protein